MSARSPMKAAPAHPGATNFPPFPNEPLVELPDGDTDTDPFGFGSCRGIDDAYDKIKQIGEGTYGQVYLAKDKRTGERVALKKVRLDNEKGEGFPVTAIREIMILKEIQHHNIINLKEIVRSDVKKSNQFKGSIYMVLDYMEHDLTGLMERQRQFTPAQIKLLMHQLLEGLNHCHECGILHRDLKGSNLLIDNSGNLKLADFGLARNCREALHLTNRTITLWYRPPELLLGAEQYRQEVDMWSVGCIFAELLTGQALFPGKNETDQLEKIFAKLGTPDEVSWPGVDNLPFFKMIAHDHATKNMLRDEFRNKIHPTAVSLLCRLLTLNPAERLTASEALASSYFRTEPLMCRPEDLPKFEDSHEWEMKQRHKRRRENNASSPQPAHHNGGSHSGHELRDRERDREPRDREREPREREREPRDRERDPPPLPPVPQQHPQQHQVPHQRLPSNSPPPAGFVPPQAMASAPSAAPPPQGGPPMHQMLPPQGLMPQQMPPQGAPPGGPRPPPPGSYAAQLPMGGPHPSMPGHHGTMQIPPGFRPGMPPGGPPPPGGPMPHHGGQGPPHPWPPAPGVHPPLPPNPNWGPPPPMLPPQGAQWAGPQHPPHQPR